MDEHKNFFKKAHDRYIEIYKKTLDEYPDSVAEVMFTEPSWVSLMSKLARIDLSWMKDSKAEFIDVVIDNPNSDNALICKSSNGLILEIAPLVWHEIEFRCANFEPEEKELLIWFDKWMDPEDKRYREDVTLGSFIHSVYFEIKKDTAIVSVDFGSAPPEALFEFIDVLKNQKNSKISISSHWK